MNSSRNSAVLNSRFTGPGSAWDKAKERAAHHQKSALRTAAELGTLPSDYCALKGDYTRVSNTTGNPYIDSGTGIQDGIPPTNYPSVHPPNEKAVSDYLNREPNPTYIRPVHEEKKAPPNIQSHPCSLPKKYDFFSQTGITKDNMAIPKPELRDANYMMPEGLGRLKKTDYANYRPSHEGRIGVEHSLNKADQPITSRRPEYLSQTENMREYQAPESKYQQYMSQNEKMKEYQTPMESKYQDGRYTPAHLSQMQDPRIQEYQRPEASIEANKYPLDMQPYLSQNGQEYQQQDGSMDRNKHPDGRYTPAHLSQMQDPRIQEYQRPASMEANKYPPDMQPYMSQNGQEYQQQDGSMDRNKYTDGRDLPQEHIKADIQDPQYKSETKFETEKPKQVNFSDIHKPDENFESLAIKGLKKIRTTNQTYGSWIGDPFLEGKDWYRSPRFPHVKSYLTKHREESGSWM